jgi:hypothetical protein
LETTLKEVYIMPHPNNKLERLAIGCTRSKSRVKDFISYNKKKDPENSALIENWARKHRNTTKTCSCPMCGNPRRYFKDLPMQEKKYGSGKIYLDE